MSGSKYDILTTCHEKDFNKLRYWYHGIQKNLTDFNGESFVVTNVKIPKKYKIQNVNYLTDNDVLVLPWEKFEGNIKERTGWYKQQFIKLFQQVTINNYLVIDTDTYINKELQMINGEKPCFYFGQNQRHQPYFDFIDTVFGFEKQFKYSFINEIMFFKRNLVGVMLSLLNCNNVEGFFNLIVPVLNQINHKTSSFSEFETYGNFIYNNFSDSYKYLFLKTKSYGLKRNFTSKEVQHLVKNSSQYDKISFHSWI